eukprot:TRINITY_DN2539_c0_g1_i1.p1 TRINITY_DN2539_c0_g1~~TRINITY_DN2539_c0_g1_i1.p1  ORF type:complete len:225 (-),score=58.98 TRINITY_DN2539_c0_g1_i1:77-724(-)
MAAPKYKLTYFDIDGRAEYIRIAFFIGGIEFEDHRISHADWPNLKSSTVWGTLPILEIAGQGTLGQSGAILRYVGKLTNLYPTNEWDAARADDVYDGIDHIMLPLGRTIHEKDSEKKKQTREELVSADGDLTKWFQNLEKKLSESKGAFAIGSELTTADLKLYVFLKWLKSGVLDHIPATFADSYPKTSAVFKAVAEHEKIVAWNKHRAALKANK